MPNAELGTDSFFLRIGDVYFDSGDKAEAENCSAKAATIWKNLHSADKLYPASLNNLAEAGNKLNW